MRGFLIVGAVLFFAPAAIEALIRAGVDAYHGDVADLWIGFLLFVLWLIADWWHDRRAARSNEGRG